MRRPQPNDLRPVTLLLSVVSAFALLASACSSGDDSGSGSDSGGSSGGNASDCPVDALDGADGPMEVVVWHAILGLAAQTVDEFAEKYNASQDKVQVSVESQGVNYEEQQTKFEAALRDPTTLPDVILAEDTNTQS